MKSLFSQIWKKALRSGENPLKLVEDVGALKGYFQYKMYDPYTNKILFESEKSNTLVNQSKTNLIRLISQGTSPWIGAINPNNLKISRMRFGNHSQGESSKLYYYNLRETSSRQNIPIPQSGAVVTSFAGGAKAQTRIDGEQHATETLTGAYLSGWVPGPNGTKIYKLSGLSALENNQNPPSHETLVVRLYKAPSPGAASELVETLTFGDPGTNYLYTRTSLGIPPSRITTVSGKKPVCTPDKGYTGLSGRSYAIDQSNAAECGTRLFYDYNHSNTESGWKVKIEEIPNNEGGRFDKISFAYEIGKYNVINSIVPKSGFNKGTGKTELDRYAGNSDWYQTLSDSEYRDCADDFIDDYSVTFSVNMTGPSGNGDTSVNAREFIRYKEAFLFNGIDEMFSMVVLPSPFDKNASTAYYISWTILAPIN